MEERWRKGELVLPSSLWNIPFGLQLNKQVYEVKQYLCFMTDW